MTVSTSASAVTIGGNGVQTSFPFNFIAVTASDISVEYTDTNGNQTVLSPSQYTLSLNALLPGAIWAIGGSVVYPISGSPIANGTLITIQRTLPLTQLISIQNQGDFNAQVVEQALDLLEMQTQQINGTFGLAFTANPADTTAPLPAPPIAQRKNTSAIFDANGNLTSGIPLAGATVSAAMIPVVTAATLALARNVLGLKAAALEALSSTNALGVIDDGAGNLTLAALPANTMAGNNTGGTAQGAALTVSQVNAMLGNTSQFFSFVGGGALSNDGPSPLTVLDIAACTSMSDDNSTLMIQASAFTKTTAAWVAGTGNGGWLDGGSMGASATGHVFEIMNTSSAAVDYGLSASVSPTLPSGYTKKRRIGSIKTDGSSHIIPFTQLGNGNFREYILGTGVLDVNGASMTSANRTLATLPSVPSGIKVRAILDCFVLSTAGSDGVRESFYITSPDEADQNTGASITFVHAAAAASGGAGRMSIRTNTSQQIGHRWSGTSNDTPHFSAFTVGWEDFL